MRERRRLQRALLVAVVVAASVSRAEAQPLGTASSPHVELREVPGRDVKQLTAAAIVEAPAHVLRAVIADLQRYPAFMPYVKESRLLPGDGSGELRVYQRLSFGVFAVADRHYVIRFREQEYLDPQRGRSWAFVWRLADELPADADADAVRVKANSGYWDLRPAAGSPSRTEVHYCVLSDPGGSLWKGLASWANKGAAPKLFSSVAREARTPRYAGLPMPAPVEPVGAQPILGDCGAAAPPPPQ